MKKLLNVFIICLSLALLVAIFPGIVPYINLGNFAFGSYVTDHPELYWPIDAGLWAVSIALFVCYIFFRKETTSFIQVSKAYGAGAKSLEHALDSKLISSVVVSMEDDVVSADPTEEEVMEEIGSLKKEIAKISTKKVNYLGVSHIPFIVSAGALFGNDGAKVSFWFYQREKQRAKPILPFGKSKNSFTLNVEKEGTSKKLLLIVESSYPVVSVTPRSFFDPMDRIRLKAQTIGTDNTPNKITLDDMARKISDTISQYSPAYEEIHLVLSANAPLCFNVGQRLNSTNMSKVCVYEFSRQLDNNRPWGVWVNSAEKTQCFCSTKTNKND